MGCRPGGPRAPSATGSACCATQAAGTSFYHAKKASALHLHCTAYHACLPERARGIHRACGSAPPRGTPLSAFSRRCDTPLARTPVPLLLPYVVHHIPLDRKYTVLVPANLPAYISPGFCIPRLLILGSLTSSRWLTSMDCLPAIRW
jgi:hypothetical protein